MAAAAKEGGGSEPPQRSVSPLEPRWRGLGQVSNALQSSSWPPPAASSCWEAPRAQTRSWGRSPRRTLTRRCLWNWCTVCCQTTGSWPGAGWSPSPSPGRGLKTGRAGDREEHQQRPKAAVVTAENGGGAAARAHLTYLAAPAVRSAASGRRCPAGACGFSASYTGCTLWLCLRSGLEMPVGDTFRHLASFTSSPTETANEERLPFQLFTGCGDKRAFKTPQSGKECH